MQGREIQTATQQTSHGKPLDRVSELTGVLAPIRPVGMGDEMARDWLVSIIAKTSHISDAMFREGCRLASCECSHHSDVLKTILNANAELDEYRRKIDAYAKPFIADHTPKKPHEISGPRSLAGVMAKVVQDATDGEA